MSGSAKKMAAASKRKYWAYKRQQQYANYQLSANRVMPSTTGFVSIKRTVAGVDFQLSQQFNGYSFKFGLNELPDVAELQKVYDQFKITMIRCDFHRIDHLTGFTTAPPTLPTLVYDPTIITATTEDNVLVAPSFITVSEFNTARMQVMKPGDVHSRIWRPKPSAAVIGSTGTSVYSAQFNGWLDVQQADVSHYGLNMAWEQRVTPTTGYTPYIRLYTTYFITFKRSR